MSREQYQFIPTAPDEIIAWITAKYEEMTGVTVQPGSPEMLYVRWAASVVIQERALTNYAANQNIPSRAAGENLDALAELFYMKERPQAKAATCTMRFHISEAQEFAVLIPGGTRATDASSTLVWETPEDVYVTAGETYADVKVQCQTKGRAGNGFVAGQINSIVDPFAYFLSCENLTESDGGADAATDEEFYELLRLSMDGYSDAGARGAYIYFAKQVSTEIADVAATSPEPSVVKLYALMKDGKPASEEIKAAILAACSEETVRPLADRVSVEDPETVQYDVEFTYFTPEQAAAGASAAEIAEKVRAAVDQYNEWQCAKLGRDINPSYLVGLLMQTGIKRVVQSYPVFTPLNDGNDQDVPQVAAVGRVNIINGGYENE